MLLIFGEKMGLNTKACRRNELSLVFGMHPLPIFPSNSLVSTSNFDIKMCQQIKQLHEQHIAWYNGRQAWRCKKTSRGLVCRFDLVLILNQTYTCVFSLFPFFSFLFFFYSQTFKDVCDSRTVLHFSWIIRDIWSCML